MFLSHTPSLGMIPNIVEYHLIYDSASFQKTRALQDFWNSRKQNKTKKIYWKGVILATLSNKQKGGRS